ncbi:hypothetical protein [Kitasatospora sp. DSM 101779]|uniref:hypothetical protein n=1 Tax=Kitasatospora sp. DSM 101779 TaxID=2853165 RepID=UPI0021DAD7E8|nr:hypothetical protein [Kitasatospora sp. DSM 101779]MCU7825140.1 hypothetical protein [Kitasatospora sp. DSM 101779]
MDIEDDLSRLLGAGADQIHVPVQTIVAEATSRGRKLRRRRRITRAAGAVAAVTLLTGGVAAFGPDTFNRSQAPATNAPSASALSVLGPTDPPVNGKVAITGAGLLGVFASLLPDSTRFSTYGGHATPNVAMLQVDVDFGDHLPSTVFVELSKEGPVGDVCHQPHATHRLACVDLPGGAKLYAETAGGDALPGSYRMVVKRPDGSSVELSVFSGQMRAANSAQPFVHNRQQPPKGQAFWAEVAKSPLWDFRIPVEIAKDGANRASALQ